MKINALNGKVTTQILSVALCAVVLIMLAATLCPYFTVAEPYNKFLNPNPITEHYTLMDMMWTDTVRITASFEELYDGFNINDYVTMPVIAFIFSLGTIATAIWFATEEYKHYPSMVSAIFCHICGILCGVFALLGYSFNAMLDVGVPQFSYIRLVIIACAAVALLLAIARFISWLLTTIQLAKERAERLAKL